MIVRLALAIAVLVRIGNKYWMFNFKVKRLDNFKFSQAELLKYYRTIKEDFQDLKWQPPGSMAAQAYSWAIQTKMLDVTKPCSPYHWPGDNPADFNSDFDTPTKLVFGFGAKILAHFPQAKQLVITVHAPGTQLPWHTDAETYLEDHWKIHLPIETNQHSLFQYEDEDFVLEAGSAYLVNTSLTHATYNQGTTERAHLIFKIPVSIVHDVITKQYEI